MRISLKTRHRAVLLIVVFCAGLALLAWKCWRDPKINFFPHDSRAEWIVFPAPLDPGARFNASFDAIFQRQFVLDTLPSAAPLHLRAAKRIELKINDRHVDVPAVGNWKEISEIDVLGFLRTGANVIEVRVFDENGPPALWLSLRADGLVLKSDQSWQTSFAGSASRSAIFASTPRPMGGEPGVAGERTLHAVSVIWPFWIVFTAVALFIATMRLKWIALPESKSRDAIVLLVISALWLLLFLNNVVRAPLHAGFDARQHLNYIKYVEERHALPSPKEGFEMFQPPLYYAVSAFALSLGNFSASSLGSAVILHFLAMLFGIAHLTLVFLILRLLFPGRFDLHLVGVLLAAFLPMQVYMSHYVTNETLAATLITAALYFGLRILKSEHAGLSQYIWLGLFLGLAALAKVTGLLLVPVLVMALAFRFATQRLPVAIGVRNLSLTLAVCLAVCGWHYLRIGLRSDTPFFGVAGGLYWWQDAGYVTATNYFRFGRSLVSPLFSGSYSFADGVYSTFWGDGLCGGESSLELRPPWNYDLMIAGYLLALVPTVVLLVGIGWAIIRYVREPSSELFTLLCLSAVVALGIVMVSIRIPSYPQGKSFYGLSILAPLAFFVALGWQTITRGRRSWQIALGTVLLFWLMNSFCSFWIRDSAFRLVHVGRKLRVENGLGAAEAKASEAVVRFPQNASVRNFRASILNELGRTSEAMDEAQRATNLDPGNAAFHLQLAAIFAGQGDKDRAIAEARRACALAPENSSTYDLLSTCLLEAAQTEEAIDVAREGLAVSPLSGRLHLQLGEALEKKNDFTGAANHFAYALMLRYKPAETTNNLRRVLRVIAGGPEAKANLARTAANAPDSPVMLDQIAWGFATHPDSTMRDGAEAVRLAERACELSQRKGAVFLNTLAAAYGETGRFSEAINVAQEAISQARSSGPADEVALGQNLLASLQADRPFRAAPISE